MIAISNVFNSEQDLINLSAAENLDKNNVQSLPLRAYFDQSLVPAIVEGMKIIAKERPSNPVEYLGLYLLNAANEN